LPQLLTNAGVFPGKGFDIGIYCPTSRTHNWQQTTGRLFGNNLTRIVRAALPWVRNDKPNTGKAVALDNQPVTVKISLEYFPSNRQQSAKFRREAICKN